MSVKREYETKTHMVTEKVLVKETMYCDICGKEIGNEPYWKLTTHHNDWGNDSIDSYEYFDICSADCLRKKCDEYIEGSGYDDGNTMVFEARKCR